MKRRTALFALAASVAFPKLGFSQDEDLAVTNAENGFAIDLYNKLDKSAGNFFASPYSVAMALGMVYAGANGRTADEIARAMHLGVLGANTKQAFLQKTKQAPPIGGAGIKFESANALWGAAQYPFHQDFIATVRSVFGGSLTPLDFSDPEDAAGAINAWVSEKTEGKITDIVPAAALNAMTRLVLTNAVYFKSDWSSPFEKNATIPANFQAPSGVKMVPTMNLIAYFSYGAGVGLKLVALPYGQGGMNMVILLPDEVDGLAAVEAGLDAALLGGWIAGGQNTQVRLALPKFKTMSSFDLNAPLQALGVVAAFSPGTADLTGIADVAGDNIYVSDALQKSYIDVDEKGTEAAAATAFVAGAAAAIGPSIPPPPPVPFIVDHPFLYLIQDTGTGRILFMGRVVDPSDG